MRKNDIVLAVAIGVLSGTLATFAQSPSMRPVMKPLNDGSDEDKARIACNNHLNASLAWEPGFESCRTIYMRWRQSEAAAEQKAAEAKSAEEKALIERLVK